MLWDVEAVERLKSANLITRQRKPAIKTNPILVTDNYQFNMK